MRPVPNDRIRVLNDREPLPRNGFILYWMTAFRRLSCNFALQRAVEWARALEKPLVIVEPLRLGHLRASDRHHRFALDGMAEHAEALESSRASYFPYVEAAKGEGDGLLEALAKRACVVVIDEYPSQLEPHPPGALAQSLAMRVDQVDSNGLLPLAAAPRVFLTPHSFRVWLGENVEVHVEEWPERDPLSKLPDVPRAKLPRELLQRWPRAEVALLQGDVSSLPIDHAVPVTSTRGGSRAARKRLSLFAREKLPKYAYARNNPGVDGSSRLSPYLHFGHLSVHEIIDALMKEEGTSRSKLHVVEKPRRRSLFGLSPAAETFLDELITWRELAFNFCSRREDFTSYTSIPEWARRSLEKHLSDPRPHRYSRRELEEGRTHDPYFNAAARQLAREGWFHNQARMIWGKRILEWSRTPEEAFETMNRWMTRWSLDGGDPNSYAGSAWILGRYDRPLGPERAIFGIVRPMPTNALRLRQGRAYIETWAPEEIGEFRRPSTTK